MRIGVAVSTGIGFAGEIPSWESMRDQAITAERIGFDALYVPDHLLWRLEDATVAFWESVSVLGALAASTSTIAIGHSVFNAPFRSPALIAKIAETLDEISGGRYILGIGAGAGATDDYTAFGFPLDKRYSRFAEAIEIIHTLLRTGEVDFTGEFSSARAGELVLRGPRPAGPPIVIAAKGPKMMRLVARYADEWNWYTLGAAVLETFRPVIATLEEACEAEGRDPSTLRRSVDVMVDPCDRLADVADVFPGGPAIAGSAAEMAEQILAFSSIGVDEVRCYPYPAEVATLQAMEPVVAAVHCG